MTDTPDPGYVQGSLLAGPAGTIHRLALEREISRRLTQLEHWTDAPDEGVDWSLEQLMDDLRALSIELRQLRNEGSIPF
jgi:hypothetical protein